VRLALLTNFIPPYRVPLFQALRAEAGELRVFVSTRMERNRSWAVDWADLDVVQLRTLTLRRRWGTSRFADHYEMHVPVGVAGHLRRYQPEAIIAGELGLRSCQAVRYARKQGVPVVLWATLADHLEQNWSAARTRFRRWLSRHADGIIVNGEGGVRYFQRLGLDDDMLVRVPYVTDLTSFSVAPAPSTDGVRELLYVGALTERKGVRHLIDALAQLSTRGGLPAIRLTVVGEGPLRDTIEASLRAAGVEVRMVGHVPYLELPRWYAQADALLFPTLGDEWGLVVNEALAAGVPVFGSVYAQAVNELIRDGVNGWCFTPTDAEGTMAAMSRMLGTPADALAWMREQARATVAGLTPEWAAARMVDFVRRAGK
jgi:glycosyltransferase involved in cell wall biosynthesis